MFLQLFHVCHVIRNRRSALLLVWYEWLSRKGREWKILLRRQNLKYKNSTSPFRRLRQKLQPRSQGLSSLPPLSLRKLFLNDNGGREERPWERGCKNCTKSVPHVQHEYFSSFNQSSHSFVALSWSLPSSFLKLPSDASDVYQNYSCG